MVAHFTFQQAERRPATGTSQNEEVSVGCQAAPMISLAYSDSETTEGC